MRSLFLVSMLLACAPNQQLPQATTTGAAVRNGTMPAVGTDPRTGAQTNDGKSGDVEAAELPEESGLPPYIFTTKAAHAIKPLVERFRKAPGDEPERPKAAQSFEPMRRFLGGFLEHAMKLPDMAPGRKFRVMIADDDFANAFADGFQVLAMNSGLFDKQGATSLGTLCHEMAHSFRNHNVKLPDVTRHPDYEAFAKVQDEFIARTYDQETENYRHDAAAFKKVYGRWRKLMAETERARKRNESEADIVGAIVCAKLGFGSKSFIDSLQHLLADDQPFSSWGDSLQDGEVVPLPQADFFDALFPMDSHPTADERVKQLQRLASYIDVGYSPDSELGQEWLNGFNDAFRASRGASLVDAPNPEPKTVVTSTGRKLELPRKPRCGH